MYATNLVKSPPEKFTLVFVKDESSTLLGLKKRGFGVGKWNGFGGKIEDGENVTEGALRELKEESNLDVKNEHLIYLGYVLYRSVSEEGNRIVYIFMTKMTFGNLAESEEMRPKWFKFDEIPYDEMWPDSKYWMPIVLKEKYLRAEFLYGEDGFIIKQVVNELNELPEH